jgi:hypothetical protein
MTHRAHRRSACAMASNSPAACLHSLHSSFSSASAAHRASAMSRSEGMGRSLFFLRHLVCTYASITAR